MPLSEVRLGLDFDNTLVNYDQVFFERALALQWIGPEVEPSKKAVRAALAPDRWTELQGVVYARHVAQAVPTPGVLDFLAECRARNIHVSVISHKTRYPVIGPRLDLHEPARQWLRNQGFAERFGIPPARWFFELTLAEKLARIQREDCTHFVDDLEEVFRESAFPSHVKRIHYAPDVESDEAPTGLLRCRSWTEVARHLLDSA